MDQNVIKHVLRLPGTHAFDLYERRPGQYQLIAPIMHEDGDMIDIYLQDSPEGGGKVRISDFGLTLMRLSYNFEVNTQTRQRIFDSILINNGIENAEGNLYLDTTLDRLYESVLQFAGCAQKVCNMRYWSREIVRSAFYDDLGDYLNQALGRFQPQQSVSPIDDHPISVDWTLTHKGRSFYIFGVRGNEKAKNVAIALLEFQKANLPFISLVVHEQMEDLGRREQIYLTKNADTQYPVLGDFQEKGLDDILRFAA